MDSIFYFQDKHCSNHNYICEFSKKLDSTNSLDYYTLRIWDPKRPRVPEKIIKVVINNKHTSNRRKITDISKS